MVQDVVIEPVFVYEETTIAPHLIAAVTSGFVGPQGVSVFLVSDTPNATIAYTLDGTDPVDEGIIIEPGVAIVVSKPTTLRAVAVSDGKNASEIAEFDINVTATNDLANAELSLGLYEYPYVGGAVEPLTYVSLGGVELERGVDYLYGYRNSDAVGTATVTVMGIGDYTGQLSITYELIDSSNVDIEWGEPVAVILKSEAPVDSSGNAMDEENAENPIVDENLDGSDGQTLDAQDQEDQNGLVVVQTGLVTLDDGNTVFLSDEGTRVTGDVEIDGSYYYFDPVTTFMVKGLVSSLPDGVEHYCDADGVWGYGMVESDDGTIRFFGEDGAMAFGDVKLADGVHHFDEYSGAMSRSCESSLEDGSVVVYDEWGVATIVSLDTDGASDGNALVLGGDTLEGYNSDNQLSRDQDAENGAAANDGEDAPNAMNGNVDASEESGSGGNADLDDVIVGNPIDQDDVLDDVGSDAA